MSKIKLSHSSVQRYSTCGESFRLHYIQKLRPKVTSASLLLGSALDEALNCLLLKDNNDPYKVFEEKWSVGYINKNRVEIKDSLQVVYAKSDLDTTILTELDIKDINDYFKKTDLINHPVYKEEKDLIKTVIKRKEQENYLNFSEVEKRLFNFINWTCLKRKGILILDAYKIEVLPRIKKVIAVQKPVEFENDEGDGITGIIDLIAELDDGNVYILDNKSSSRPYEQDSVITSPQLAIYAHHEGIDRAGFIVFQKSIKKDKHRVCEICGNVEDNNRVKTCSAIINNKRCNGNFIEKITPRAEIQIILDKVNPNLINMVMKNFEDVNVLVNQGVFLKNLRSCTDTYGGYCPYYKYCHKNDPEGLEQV
jgi:hypothetical protein